MNDPKHDAARHGTEQRPAWCCGKCPPIVGSGYDCTCDGNPRCTTDQKETAMSDQNAARARVTEFVEAWGSMAHAPEVIALTPVMDEVDGAVLTIGDLRTVLGR